MCEPTFRTRESGFSLIEIMVGLVIGMLSIVIIMQMFSNADANKRNTVGGNDAQTNTTIALYNLERDVRMGGYGLSATTLLGCKLTFTPSGESTAVSLTAISPVTINPPATQIPAGDTNTDTLLVMYGSSHSPAEGDALISTSTNSSYTVATASSFAIGDFVIAETLARPSPCNLVIGKVTQVTGSILTIQNGVTGLATGSVVFNLGQAPVIRAYAIRNGELTMCDYMTKNCGDSSYVTTLDPQVWVPVASNIVSLRAQYGRDTSAAPMSGATSTWDQTNPLLESDTGASTASPPIYCAHARKLAVRAVLVGRSAAYDKALEDSGGTGNPTWSGSATHPINLSGSLDTSNGWKGYRYKAMETTVPLRNTIWRGGDTTC